MEFLEEPTLLGLRYPGHGGALSELPHGRGITGLFGGVLGFRS